MQKKCFLSLIFFVPACSHTTWGVSGPLCNPGTRDLRLLQLQLRRQPGLVGFFVCLLFSSGCSSLQRALEILSTTCWGVCHHACFPANCPQVHVKQAAAGVEPHTALQGDLEMQRAPERPYQWWRWLQKVWFQLWCSFPLFTINTKIKWGATARHHKNTSAESPDFSPKQASGLACVSAEHKAILLLDGDWVIPIQLASDQERCGND